MKIDLANLGPPGKSVPGLDLAKVKLSAGSESKNAQGADSFDQLLLRADQRRRQVVDSKDAQSEVVPYKNSDPKVPKRTEQSLQGQNQRTRESQEPTDNGFENNLRASSEKQKDTPSDLETSKSKNRIQAMLEFMDSMESEFGVPPELIAGALAGLSVEDLQKPAEQTANLVISRLGLETEDEERAMQLYSGMLAQLQAVPPNKEMFFVPMTSTQKMPGLDPRAELNSSIDQMNSKFFLWDRNQNKAQNKDAESLIANAKQGGETVLPHEITRFQEGYSSGSFQLPARASVDLPEAGLMPKSGLSPEDSSEVLKSLNQEQSKELNPQQIELLKKLSTLGAAASALNEAVSNEVESSVKAQATQQSLQDLQSKAASVPLPDMSWMQRQDQQTGAEAESGKNRDSSESFKDLSASSLIQDAQQSHPEFFPKTLESALNDRGSGQSQSLAMGTSPNAEQRSEAISQLMNQGKYLIKKGGGEMKIQMSPEGLGKLHMKVVVSEGKVDVQLKTETTEAKKALESSLSELKSSLGAHKLNLEQIRVDVSQKFSDSGTTFSDSGQKPSDSRNDLTRDQGRDSSRDQARQFLGEFRDGNFSQRSFMFDSPKTSRYFSGPSVDPLKPSPIKESSMKRYSGQGKGSGLDLVA